MMKSFLLAALGIPSFSALIVSKMLLRSVLIYFLGITLARFNRKMMGIRTPFNFLLFVMLGSFLAVAIIEEEFFVPIIITVCVLFLLNGLTTILVFHSTFLEDFIKGPAVYLIKDGTIQWNEMKKHFITKRELINELNSQLHTRNIKMIESAILASDGTINFIKRPM